MEFIKNNKIAISTSLDGPKEIHNKCRILRNGNGSYDYVIKNIEWAVYELGEGMVSALLTVWRLLTPYNLNRLNEVISEYIYRAISPIFSYAG